jgi:hypothetical protein
MGKNFFDNLIFDLNYKRNIVGFETNNLKVLEEKYNLGWSIYIKNHAFFVRAPEDVIVDLSDIFKIIKIGSPIDNLVFYDLINDFIANGKLNDLVNFILKKNNLKDFSFIIPKGDFFETQFRMIGSDLRIKQITKLLLKEFKKDKKTWNKYYKKSLSFLNSNRISYKDFFKKNVVYHNSVQDINIRNLIEKFQLFRIQFKKFKYGSYLRNFLISGLFKKLPEANFYVLVPNGCFYFLPEFLESKNRLKYTVFIKLHLDDKEPYLIYPDIDLIKNFKNKKILIIDTVFSGNTLNKLYYFIKNHGGTPIKMAVFPKSKIAIEQSNYILFVNKIIESNNLNLINILKEKNWVKILYRYILVNKN